MNTFLTLSLLFVFLPEDNCRLAEYRRLKTTILDLYDKRYMGSNSHSAHKDNMAARKQLVEVMFKHFDADNSGRVDAHELSQVSNKQTKKLLNRVLRNNKLMWYL